MDFAVPAEHSVKLKESEKKDMHIDFAKELKTVEHKSGGFTNCNWCSCYSHQLTNTRTGVLGNKRTSGDHPNYLIIEIGHNTEKSPGDMGILIVTETLEKDNQLTLM